MSVRPVTRMLLLVVPLGVVVALVAAAAWTGDDGQEKPSPRAEPAVDSGSIDLSSRAEAIAAYSRKRFPDTFAGVAVDERARAVLVYRRLPGAALDAAVTEEFRGVRLAFRDAPRSERNLRKLTRQVIDDLDSWRERGIEIHGVGPDFVRGVVIVITPDGDTAERPLRDRYGDRVVVQEGTVAPPPTTGPPPEPGE